VLVATEAVGRGRVVAVGDASLYINAMQGLREGDNEVFLARLAPDGTLVDARISRTASASGAVGMVLWLQGQPVLIVSATAIALGALALVLGRRGVA
jgi:hypothetical protein